jgi:hypothetical protein
MHVSLITNTKIGKEASKRFSMLDGMIRNTKRDDRPRVITGIVLQTKPRNSMTDVVMKAKNPVPKTMPMDFGQVPYSGRFF